MYPFLSYSKRRDCLAQKLPEGALKMLGGGLRYLNHVLVPCGDHLDTAYEVRLKSHVRNLPSQIGNRAYSDLWHKLYSTSAVLDQSIVHASIECDTNSTLTALNQQID